MVMWTSTEEAQDFRSLQPHSFCALLVASISILPFLLLTASFVPATHSKNTHTKGVVVVGVIVSGIFSSQGFSWWSVLYAALSKFLLRQSNFIIILFLFSCITHSSFSPSLPTLSLSHTQSLSKTLLFLHL